MTGTPASASVLTLVACFVLIAAMTTLRSAQAQNATLTASTPAGLIHFDIAAQPLGDALDAFGRATGLSVLIDSRNSVRDAPALHGAYSESGALAALLAGSGLHAAYPDSRSIVIEGIAQDAPVPAAPPARSVAAADIPGVIVGGQDFRDYAARVQSAVQRALCRVPQTRPGSYRLALQLDIDARGRVAQLRLLDTTGNAARDAAIARVVQAVDVGAAPAASMPQPIVMLLLPQGPLAQLDCAAATADRPGLSPGPAG
jgi:hypothetical protein